MHILIKNNKISKKEREEHIHPVSDQRIPNQLLLLDKADPSQSYNDYPDDNLNGLGEGLSYILLETNSTDLIVSLQKSHQKWNQKKNINITQLNFFWSLNIQWLNSISFEMWFDHTYFHHPNRFQLDDYKSLHKLESLSDFQTHHSDAFVWYIRQNLLSQTQRNNRDSFPIKWK